MSTATPIRFQVLALSGGGFRGAYTARFLADIEEELGGRRIANCFDLIAGTSIGGILALALALEIPANEMVDLFDKHGEEIFRKRVSLLKILKSPYSPKPLQRLLEADGLFGQRLLGACKHPVIVPSINYTKGEPVLFKTPHHTTLKRDHKHRLVDISLATSAAPSYFPRHRFDNSQYVDGGLYANAPGLLALHEAEHFLGADPHQVWLMSIGTMSSKFTVNPKQGSRGGAMDWGHNRPHKMPERLFGLAISVQETLSRKMLEHELGERYLHIDDIPTNDAAKVLALDAADKYAKEALFGTAAERSKDCIGKSTFQAFLAHSPAKPVFFYGENANV